MRDHWTLFSASLSLRPVWEQCPVEERLQSMKMEISSCKQCLRILVVVRRRFFPSVKHLHNVNFTSLTFLQLKFYLFPTQSSSKHRRIYELRSNENIWIVLLATIYFNDYTIWSSDRLETDVNGKENLMLQLSPCFLFVCHIFYDVSWCPQLLCVFIGYFERKFILNCHNNLYVIQRIESQVVCEVRIQFKLRK